jgi:hypothetical protein
MCLVVEQFSGEHASKIYSFPHHLVLYRTVKVGAPVTLPNITRMALSPGTSRIQLALIHVKLAPYALTPFSRTRKRPASISSTSPATNAPAQPTSSTTVVPTNR